MKQWHIKVVGKQQKEVDKHLIVQAILAFGRQLKEQPAKPEQRR